MCQLQKKSLKIYNVVYKGTIAFTSAQDGLTFHFLPTRYDAIEKENNDLKHAVASINDKIIEGGQMHGII